MAEYTTISPTVQPSSFQSVTEFAGKEPGVETNKKLLQHLNIQCKIAVGNVDDPLEDEADTMADKIMRMPAETFIQRKCTHCEEEEKAQRKPLTSFIQKKSVANSIASDTISSLIQSTKGSGNRMPDATKSFMESRFADRKNQLQRKEIDREITETEQKPLVQNALHSNSFIQLKLTINQPNDVYEQEADSIADKVMRMPEKSPSLAGNKPFFSPPTVNINKANTAKEEPLKKEIEEEQTEESIPEIQAKLLFDGLPPPPDDNKENNTTLIQRKCAYCEEEENKIQRNETNSSEVVADTSTENYISTLNGKGRSLTEGERKFFEPRIGYDFSNVQLHTNEEANQSAKSINALAYTRGNHIAFAAGKYQPNTDSGRRLIAHELAHVVQQKGTPGSILARQPGGLAEPAPAENIPIPMPIPEVVPEPLPEESQREGEVIWEHPDSPGKAPANEAETDADPFKDPFGARVGPRVPTPRPVPPPYKGDMGDYTDWGRGADYHAKYIQVANLRAELEQPVATLDAGGSPPGFITIEGTSTHLVTKKDRFIYDKLAEGSSIDYKGRDFHILDAIEFYVGKAANAQQIITLYFYYFPELSGNNQFPGIITAYQEADPTGARRWEVFIAAAKKRANEVPALEVVIASFEKERKRRRSRKCKRTPGPCPVWRPRLTKRNPYMDLAFFYRAGEGLLNRSRFGTNIAILFLEGGETIIEESVTGVHSERIIAGRLASRNITSECPIIALFSERTPCQKPGGCQSQVLPNLCRLNNGVPFDIFYACEYSDEGMKTTNNRHELIKCYVEAGYFQDL